MIEIEIERRYRVAKKEKEEKSYTEKRREAEKPVKIKTKKIKAYDEDSFKFHTLDVDKVRARPSMYMGSTPIFQCVKEVVDNSIDEYNETEQSAKHWNIYISYTCDKKSGKHTFTVADKGRGIPIGINKDIKVSTLTGAFTQLQGGGKFDAKAYEAGKGTNGTGVCATNALSEQLEVWTHRDKRWWYQKFEFGKPVTEVIRKKPEKQFIKNSCGTVVSFTVDNSIEQISVDTFDLSGFKTWLNVTSMIDSPIRILFEYGSSKKGLKTIEYFKPDGAVEYLKMKLEEYKLETFGKKPFVFTHKFMSCIFQWASTEETHFDAYTNGIYNIDGGTHLQGFYSSLVKAFNIVVNNKKKELKESDLRAGLIGLVNVRVPEAQYKDQVKNELKSPVKKKVEETLIEPLTAWFNSHKSLVKEIQERATALRDAKEKAKELMKAASKVKTKGQSLPSKLVMCDSKTPVGERELFILEGDSAGGPAKRARDRRYQMVLPLKGKPINVARCSVAKALGSVPVKEILTTIGFDAKSYAKIGKSLVPFNVGRIVLTADADEDGRHIENLILTVLYKFVPDVFKNNMVYLVDSPLYIVRSKGKKNYAYTYKEAVKKYGDKAQLKRMKGWAEANDDELEYIAFKKDTRKLWLVRPVPTADGKAFLKIVGEDTAERKRILKIESYADPKKLKDSSPKPKKDKKVKEIKEETKVSKKRGTKNDYSKKERFKEN
jgi:DNA gyrase subunit B